MPSYSPEAIELARRPIFNTDATTIFEGGIVTPTGLKAVDVTSEITLPDAPPAGGGQQPPPPGGPNPPPPQAPATGPAKTLAVTNGGAGLTDGTPTAVATTATKGTGSGLTVDLTITGNVVTAATVNAGGTGYATGDTVSVTGQAGVVLTVTI